MMKILIFPFFIISSLFWHVFSFNENKNETLHQGALTLLLGR